MILIQINVYTSVFCLTCDWSFWLGSDRKERRKKQGRNKAYDLCETQPPHVVSSKDARVHFYPHMTGHTWPESNRLDQRELLEQRWRRQLRKRKKYKPTRKDTTSQMARNKEPEVQPNGQNSPEWPDNGQEWPE